MFVIPGVLFTVVVLVAGLLFAFRSTGPLPLLGEDGRPLPGSVAEKVFVEINGVKQGMFIRSRNTANPVLLFLHGGPAMPEYTFAPKYPAGLEDRFTVCYWEQRGAGLSYSLAIPPETLTAEQLVSDTLAVTDYLRKRFGQDKIYLLGHSWGSLLGIQAAARAPQLYHAYIGMAQLSRQSESEKLAYTYMLEQFTKAGDKRMVQKMQRFPVPELAVFPNGYRGLRDEAMHKLGVGTTHKMRSVVSGIFLPVLKNREYTFRERINVWRGKWSAASTQMWTEMLTADLTAKVPKLEIPVYFLHGIHDYTVCYPLAKDYFQKLKAPRKGFYTFEQSAHSPAFEEPERARRILTEDVLAGVTNLADVR